MCLNWILWKDRQVVKMNKYEKNDFRPLWFTLESFKDIIVISNFSRSGSFQLRISLLIILKKYFRTYKDAIAILDKFKKYLTLVLFQFDKGTLIHFKRKDQRRL